MELQIVFMEKRAHVFMGLSSIRSVRFHRSWDPQSSGNSGESFWALRRGNRPLEVCCFWSYHFSFCRSMDFKLICSLQKTYTMIQPYTMILSFSMFVRFRIYFCLVPHQNTIMNEVRPYSPVPWWHLFICDISADLSCLDHPDVL